MKIGNVDSKDRPFFCFNFSLRFFCCLVGVGRLVQEKKSFVNKNKGKTKKETKRRPFIGRLKVFEVSNFLFWLLLYTTPRHIERVATFTSSRELIR